MAAIATTAPGGRSRLQRSPANLGAQMNTLPTQIYNDITSPRDAIINRAWGAALTLVLLTLILNVIARAFARRSRMA